MWAASNSSSARPGHRCGQVPHRLARARSSSVPSITSSGARRSPSRCSAGGSSGCGVPSSFSARYVVSTHSWTRARISGTRSGGWPGPSAQYAASQSARPSQFLARQHRVGGIPDLGRGLVGGLVAADSTGRHGERPHAVGKLEREVERDLPAAREPHDVGPLLPEVVEHGRDVGPVRELDRIGRRSSVAAGVVA